ncbi:MAG: hypothetical protein OHK0039_18830 [Bacteroidia bacterium]
MLAALPLAGQPTPASPALRLHYQGYYVAHPGASLAWEQPLWHAVGTRTGRRPGEVWHTLFLAP